MGPGPSSSSLLLELDIPERNLKACLMDPFIPLLRGIGPAFRLSVIRPPTKPYAVSGSPSAQASLSQVQANEFSPSGPRKPYSKPDSKCALASKYSSEPPVIGFVGKARRRLAQVMPNPQESHHKLIQSDISASVDAIRTRWIETEPLRGHSEWWAEDYEKNRSVPPRRAQLKLYDKKIDESLHPGAPNWAEVTRNSSKAGLSGHTYVNTSPNSIQGVPLLDSYTVHLPPQSGFSLSLLEDFPRVVSSMTHVDGWDAIVIDPPWENKSVSRSSKYRSIELYDLFKLQLPQMLGENGMKRALVAIWVTNRPKFRRFLMSKFMPASQIIGPYAEWYWVKITASPIKDGQRLLCEGGKPIFELSSNSPRRCYEGVILGWYTPASLRSRDPTENVPLKKVFLCAPLDHSRKPNLADLLQPYLPANPNFLELFARTTSCSESRSEPGLYDDGSTSPYLSSQGFWHSIGDESPKFNGSPWLENDATI